MSTGKLELIIGPMFAGKTTKIIDYAEKFPREKSLRIGAAINSRDMDKDGKIIYCSHDKKVLGDVVALHKLNDIFKLKEYSDVTCVFIEELQFFEDAFDAVVNMIDRDGKYVYATGLDGTFMREPFGDVLRLIPYADKVSKLVANCVVCKSHAPFTKKISSKISKGKGKGKDVIVEVGGSDIYQPMCRRHFLA